MTKEELLNPRYKVIADYPNSRFEIGDIVHKYIFPSGNGTYLYVTNLEIPLKGISIKYEYAESMPHLFKSLQWWEERKPEDMPEYVKYVDISMNFPNGIVCIASEAPFNANDFTAKNFWPSSKEEYITFINNRSVTT